ncbi:hypothetical protein [Paraburkholderia atlantica]|uniref:hypothetical protein n=1 Tax=Paraburkholderia atlantica TaxID=2654982 RepID=UPI00037F06E5|nr:hypothetical protein [Paraburkholderia atlantica]
MNFKLLAVYHPYISAPHKLRVELAIALNVDGDSLEQEQGSITVWIEPTDVKAATLAEIEELAIARARAISGS